MRKTQILSVFLMLFGVGLLYAFSNMAQEKKTLQERVVALETKVKEIENRLNKIEGKTTFQSMEKSIPTIDLSSPQAAAKSFWTVLQNNDIDTATKFYISVEESKVFGQGASAGWAQRLDREIKQLQDSHLPDAQGGVWDHFEITEEEYSAGRKVVQGIIYFKKGEQIGQIRLALINLSESIWKLGDVD